MIRVRATHLAAFAGEQRAGLLDLWAVYEQLRARAPETALAAALREPEWAPALRAHTVDQLTAQAERTRVLLRNAIVDGDWPPYIEHTRALGARSAALGASLSSWAVVIRGLQRQLTPALVEAYAAAPARLTAALAAMTELIGLSTSLVAEPYAGPPHDADAYKRLQAALELRGRELDDANRALEAFSYSVAHDLRAPLRAMNGFAQILLEDHAFRLEPEAVAYLRKIQGNATRMGVLIDALLGLSQLSRTTLQIQNVDLSAMAQGVASQLAAADPRRTVDVTIEPGLTAMADARLARSVFDNLLGNAWKFTARAASPKIAVGSADGRTFFVRDNGVGFDMDHAGNLFAPFERMHTVDEFPGTGIGLAIVKRIVQRHGGRVSVTAKLAAGATFFFTLSPSG